MPKVIQLFTIDIKLFNNLFFVNRFVVDLEYLSSCQLFKQYPLYCRPYNIHHHYSLLSSVSLCKIT